MQQKQHDYIAAVGRFQPQHNGHLDIFAEAIKRAKKSIIIFVGSVNGPRTPKNPFTFDQRADMISATLDEMGCEDYFIRPLKDYRYSNTAWMESVQEQVAEIAGSNADVKLIGYHKDASSGYLTWFPQWGEPIYVDVDASAETINATDIRQILFENKDMSFLKGVLPKSSLEFITQFRLTAEFQRLKHEYEVNKAYDPSKYPIKMVTVDAVVSCVGHVLMVRRGRAPGKGQWAIPGGYLDQDERIVDGIIRELKEETDIDISDRALKGLIRHIEVFDAPNRDPRGRVITHAAHIVVDIFKGKLPKVRVAGTDPEEIADVKWVPLSELREDEIYADHYDIVMKMHGMIK